MELDLQKFYQACNPSKTLVVSNPLDRQYYIDFASVRGGRIIEELKENITFFSPDEPTCELFTGHIGCGKSTELLRLKVELEEKDFHVVYFESSQDLEMSDVDIADIMLAIAHQVSESLESQEILQLSEPKGLKSLLLGIAKLFQVELEVSAEAKLPLGIGKITAKAKDSPELRNKLREYLGPRTKGILDAINEELLQPATEKLKQRGKKGLVVIVDNLDRVESSQKPWGRSQPEYLFVDRGEQLRQLKCHVVYTMPLSLRFSNDIERLTQRFMVNPKVLPMVPVQQRGGIVCVEGMYLLKQMVLARAFPLMPEEYRFDLITKVFDSPETLERLCRVSGGHVRELLMLLYDWIKKERRLPLSKNILENVIKFRCNQMKLAITDLEWELLRQVAKDKQVRGDEDYRSLVHSRFVYEYCDSEGSWFDINPILAEAAEF
ncbi:P-loop NTPase fold protein [Iningainema tapete]|uniref:AAA family ATPase n=1 Tax=Iningainema tapete BLCC-T55 TaxID=2748662 RepID=A0A8J7C5D0_9CYAN|nr:P-loop NTPase fold protein [Iningainema tapete]MBD2772964.1 AAA family ATPase [Iningainema tapete BLCC-T55]